MDNPQLWHLFGLRKYLDGELNSPVVEWLNKGLTAAWSPSPTLERCPVSTVTGLAERSEDPPTFHM
eukprot:1192494-Prorocentrum_minimum.AAC.2